MIHLGYYKQLLEVVKPKQNPVELKPLVDETNLNRKLNNSDD